MKQTWTYEVRCYRIFVPNEEELTPSGKPKMIPLIQRWLYITGDENGLDFMPREYRVFQVNRRGETHYSLSCKPMLLGDIWKHPAGKHGQTWFYQQDAWKRQEKLNWEGLLRFLKPRFGMEAEKVLHEYMNAIPIKRVQIEEGEEV